jgi:ribosomal protein S18 acetylase RimI-like enzyme
VIRTAVVADLPRLRQVYRRSSLSNEGDRVNLLAHGDLLEFSGEGLGGERTRVALDAHGSIMGFSTFVVVGDTMEIEDLFVDPPWMRQGVGRALVVDLVAIARARSFTQLEVTANPHAMAFYQSLGFVAGRDVETRFYSAPRMHLTVLP